VIEPRHLLPERRLLLLRQLLARRLLHRERIEDLLPGHELVVQVRRERVAGVAALAHHLAARHVRTDGQRRRLRQVQEERAPAVAAVLV